MVESGFKKVGGVELYYEVMGNGKPLVMIMGLTANSKWWPPQLLDALAEQFKVIIFDNRGAGRSSRSDDPFNMMTMADDTIGLMDALGVDNAHLLGVSMGGMIAQEIALNYPQRVDKLVLCATAPGGAKTVLKPEVIANMVQSNQLPLEDREKFIVDVLFTEDFVTENADLVEEYCERLREYPMDPPYIMRQTEAVVGFDSFHRLGDIKASTLVIGGSEDKLLPPENSRLIAENITGAKLIILEGMGHAVMAEPDNFVLLILGHLK